jgi:hypothetical protein
MMNSRLILLVLAMLMPACAAPDGSTSHPQPVYDKKTGELIELTYDQNGNGRADAWVHLAGSRILRAEADHDEDGRIDRWEAYRAEGAVGKIWRIEISTRRDGRIDRTEFFVDDLLDRVEEDADGDGRTDKWETYRDGALAAVAFDTQGRGSPDRRLVYRADGNLDYLEVDADGDATFQPVASLGHQ